MKKNSILILFFSAFLLSVYAAIPSGYYATTEGKKAAILKTELHRILCQDTSQFLDYGAGKGYTWEGFYTTDRDLITDAVVDMYSDLVRYFPNPNPDFVSFGQTIHIEHSVPKSWWKCDIDHPDCPAKDLNHLFPADGPTNSSKNDNPLGVVSGTPTYDNGVSRIGPAVYSGYTGAVFEPADKYKGDFARAYFYMATAYEHYARKWDTTKPENMMENNTYPVLKPWALDLLLQWHRQDPISQKEILRNEDVYTIQKNRNPYIDQPMLVEYIWGTRTTMPYRLDLNTVFPYLKWPNENDTLNLGKVSYNSYKDTTILLQAMHLTGDLTLALGGVNAANYSIDKQIITKAEAEAGAVVNLHYNALTVNDQIGILTIYGGGITPISIKLKTSTSDEFAALPASNTTNNGFVADWTPSFGATDYALNVYTIEKIGSTFNPLLEQDFTLLLPNTWLREGYTDLSLPGNIKMGTASTYGKITTPALDLSKSVTTLTVKAKQFSNDTGAKLIVTLDNQPLTTWTTSAVYQDFVVELPVSTIVSKVALSTISGKRVYIDNLKVTEEIPTYGPISVIGYPTNVGNTYSYSVGGLQSAAKYYYTVTPLGNGGVVSNQVAVQTSVSTKVENQVFSKVFWQATATGISVYNVECDAQIQLLDVMGRVLQSFTTTESYFTVDIQRHGIFLLKIHQKEGFKSYKISY